MKKFIKWFILLVVLFIPSFSSSDNVESLGSYTEVGYNLSSSYSTIVNNTNFVTKSVCFSFDGTWGNNSEIDVGFSSSNNGTPWNVYKITVGENGRYFCLNGNQYFRALCNGGGNCQGILKYFVLDVLMNTTLPKLTSLECQTEYNLIPISEVTANYCKLNFDLISPLDCPSGDGSGTGSIVFSNVYVNNVLYPGGADIYLNVNELLATDISYDSSLMYIDVDFSGDPDYIDGVVSINSYRPTSEDFSNIFVGGLVRLFPFIVIALFIAFVRKLIRKIFK